MRADRRDLVAVLILAALWWLFSWRYLTTSTADRVAFPEGDFSHHYYVYRSFAYAELSSGRFPLWMDCVFAGYPFQADPQSALFYPPALANLGVHALVGAGQFPLAALQTEALLHLLVASLLTYAFLRAEVRWWLAAVLAAIAFAYGGYLTGYPPLQIAILEGAVWLPLVLWGARGLAGRATRWHALAMVAGLSLSVLAGNPQTYVHVGYATLAYYGYRCWRQGTRWPRALGRLAIVGLFVAGVCAVQLLPSFEYARHSTRADIPFDESATGFPLRDIVQLVLPGVVSLWQPLYVGIWPLSMVVLACWSRRHSEWAFWAGLAVVSLLLSFGQHMFGYDLAYLAAPGYALFRSQERHAFLFSFALSVLGAFGLDALLMPLSRRGRRALRGVSRLAASSLPVIAVLLVAVVLLEGAGVGDWGRLPFAERLAGLVLFTGATAALLQARLRSPRRRALIGGLALALVVVDLYTVDRPVNYAEPVDPFPPQPALAEALRDGLPFFRIQDDWRLPGHTACMNGLQEVYGIASIKPQKIEAFTKQVPEPVRWALLGVRYVVTWRGSLQRPDGTPVPAEQLYHQGEPPDVVYTYRLAGEPSFAWVAHEVWTASDREDMWGLLGDPAFDPQRVAVVEGGSPDLSAAVEAGDSVAVLERVPGRARLRAELGSAGLLVISQALYPGWKATVNGEPAPIVEADGLLAAVALPAGSSDVALRYWPLTFAVGLGLSALALVAGVVALVAVPRRRDRRSPSG